MEIILSEIILKFMKKELATVRLILKVVSKLNNGIEHAISKGLV